MISMPLRQRMEKFTVADELKQAGLYPYFQVIESNNGPLVRIQGKQVIMFGSNSYMGLTCHPEVKKAVCNAATRFGSSCSGSRFLNGTTILHTELEEKLAAFVGKEAAIVFSTGYQTNLGVVATLTGRSGVLFLDELDHASIIEGSRLSFSRVFKFRHNDMDDLKHQLSMYGQSQVKLIVIDGVFSMEGDVASLPEIVRLAREYDAAVMVDDAHGLGVMGPHGEGTAAHFGLADEVDLIMGTFSKSLASLGGYVAGELQVINYIKHHARSLIFSASIPASAAAAAMAALDIIRREPERLERLWANTHYMIQGLGQCGLDIGNTSSPIIPVYIRNDPDTFRFTNRLLEEGIFVNPVVSPAVKSDRSLIRLSVMATHTRNQIDYTIEKVSQVAAELGLASTHEEVAYVC